MSGPTPAIVAGWYERAAADPARVVLADLGDPRADEAAALLRDEGLAVVVEPVVDPGDVDCGPAIAAGLDPADPAWGPTSGHDDQLTSAVDALVRGLLDQRAQARAAKDFAAADAIRDQIKAAGIEVEDTPDGPKWSLINGR